MRPCHCTLKVFVCLGNSVDAGEDGRGLGAAIENEDRRLAIAPGRVAEELVDCFAERLRPLPELALGNEVSSDNKVGNLRIKLVIYE